MNANSRGSFGRTPSTQEVRLSLASVVKIKEIKEHLPTAEQIRQQIEIAEEEFRLSVRKKTE